MNNKLHETKEEIRIVAIVNNVSETYEGDLRRTKKIWKKDVEHARILRAGGPCFGAVAKCIRRPRKGSGLEV